MREGLLWFDNSDERDWAAKIVRAAQYYKHKFSQYPTLATVHPNEKLNSRYGNYIVSVRGDFSDYTIENILHDEMLESSAFIRVRADLTVLPNHLHLTLDWDTKEYIP